MSPKTKTGTCAACGEERSYLEDGEICASCVAEAERRTEDALRRAAREADRRRLGLRPARKARNLVLISLDAAAYWTAWMSRFAEPGELDAVRRLQEGIAVLRQEMEA